MPNYNNNSGGGTVMLAFLVGAVAGAAAALLFAPASGEETREYLGQKAREGRAKARRCGRSGPRGLRRQKEQLTSAVDRGREAFQQAREQGRTAGVSPTAEVLLGVIAVAVAVMAIVQVGAIIAGLRVARRVEKIATDLETGVKPLLANLTTISAEASRAANLAAAQVERFDKTFADLTTRVDQTLVRRSGSSTDRPARAWRSSPASGPR